MLGGLKIGLCQWQSRTRVINAGEEDLIMDIGQIAKDEEK